MSSSVFGNTTSTHAVDKLFLRPHRQVTPAGGIVTELFGPRLVVHLDRGWRGATCLPI